MATSWCSPGTTTGRAWACRRARFLRSLMGRLNQPLVYLSAHTHSGFWAVHHSLVRQPLLELNVSSLSDWPIAYRRISFAWNEADKRLLVRGELMPHGDKPNTSYADLLAAWEAETCQRAGIPIEDIRQHDLAVVKLQRESRGSVMEWLLSAIPACETCQQPLYEHAQAYQDAMLQTLVQGAPYAREMGDHMPSAHTAAGVRRAEFRHLRQRTHGGEGDGFQGPCEPVSAQGGTGGHGQ
jgi:hypothetical protein